LKNTIINKAQLLKFIQNVLKFGILLKNLLQDNTIAIYLKSIDLIKHIKLTKKLSFK